MLTSIIRLIGMDPSLRHWGLAAADYDLATHKLTVVELGVIEPHISTSKQVRQSNKDLDAAVQLYMGARRATKTAHATFVEVPVGSQSARAMASYALCVGILGALRATNVPFHEVTATEVKLAGHGTKDASKKAMIAWGLAAHPEANWPYYKKNGVRALSEARAEHMADALAAIYAGIRLPVFQQTLALRAA